MLNNEPLSSEIHPNLGLPEQTGRRGRPVPAANVDADPWGHAMGFVGLGNAIKVLVSLE